MPSSAGIHQAVDIKRTPIAVANAVRTVHVSELTQKQPGTLLSNYIADKTPLFYREIEKVAASLGDGCLLSTIKETLCKLPESASFRESHFGEITSSIFAEDVLGLRKIYSKLSLLTAENSNAFKMDLVLCLPHSDPVEFIFGEVKSSTKHASVAYPAGHDTSCFSSIFTSFNKYGEDDLDFDLAAAKDRISILAPDENERVRNALKPYGSRTITYLGFAIIDLSTKHDGEASLLATRVNDKSFNIELVCLENYEATAQNVYTHLEALKKLCLP